VRRELIDLAAELARRGEPFALATVVARRPPISAQVGDVALVTRDGFHGWVGGSCTRPTVTAEAREALEDGQPRLVSLDPDPESRRREGLRVFPMTCHSGGSVEIHIQPVLPAPRLIVYGVSPTARALARLAKAMGYTVWAVDPVADASAFPGADTVATDPKDLAAAATPAPVYAVVATQGQWDEEAVLAALAHDPAYLAVVASPKRFGEMRDLLRGGGKTPAGALDRVRNPAGLDLGARLPEEIALSILAEIVKERRAAALRPAPVAARPAAEEALDPVCGMTVRVAEAPHQAPHSGRVYYFCCAGCRERFVAAPERYLAVAEAP
jgi:xanthine dehydrogenase accessory factor